MAHARIVIACLGILVLSFHGRAAAVEEAEISQPVRTAFARLLAQRYDGIRTLQFRFRASVRYLAEEEILEKNRLRSYELKEGLFAYDAQSGTRYIQYYDTGGRIPPKDRAPFLNEGAGLRKIVSGPSYERTLFTKADGTERATIGPRNERHLLFDSPDEILGLFRLERMRRNLDDGKFVVELAPEGGDPQISLRDAPHSLGDRQRGVYYVFVLDETHEFFPTAFRIYVGGKLAVEQNLVLFQPIPGVQLPSYSLQRSWTVLEEEGPYRRSMDCEHWVDKASVRINEPLPQDLFDLPFPKGASVADNLAGVRYAEGLEPAQATPEQVLSHAEQARSLAPLAAKGSLDLKRPLVSSSTAVWIAAALLTVLVLVSCLRSWTLAGRQKHARRDWT